MRNNNTAKYIVVIALLISVTAVTIGFAAMSQQLTIQSSATVTGNTEFFDIQLSKSQTAVSTGAVSGVASGVSGATAANATIANDGHTISGIKATFTKPGQTVTYSLYAYNAGAILGYLNSVNIGAKSCEPKSGTTASYVTAACADISLSVKVGSNTYNSSNTNISSHTLAASAGEVVQVIVTYADNNHYVDGDFDVNFGDTTIIYGSAD